MTADHVDALVKDTASSFPVIQSITAISVSTAVWFIVNDVIGAENVVVPWLPDPVRVPLQNTKVAGLPPAEVQNLAVSLRNRCAGILHALGAVLLAVWVVNDPAIYRNPVFGTSFSWLAAGESNMRHTVLYNYVMHESFSTGAFAVGYFIWDVITLLKRIAGKKDEKFFMKAEEMEFLLHGVVCLGALASTFMVEIAPFCYYGGLFLFLEATTPFMGFRWCCIRSKQILQCATQCIAEKGVLAPNESVHSIPAEENSLLPHNSMLSCSVCSYGPPPSENSGSAKPCKCCLTRTAGEALPSKEFLDMAQNSERALVMLDSLVLASSIIFAGSFIYFRIVWQLKYLLYPLFSLFLTPPFAQLLAPARRWFYLTAIPVFYALNLYWMVAIASSVRKAVNSRKLL